MCVKKMKAAAFQLPVLTLPLLVVLILLFGFFGLEFVRSHQNYNPVVEESTVNNYYYYNISTSMLQQEKKFSIDKSSSNEKQTKQDRRRRQLQQTTNRTKCPPKGFNALTNFNIRSYISARWYVQRQKPVIYSGEESFCSYAQYTIDEDSKPLCLGLFCERNSILKINVKNRGLIGSVTGNENIAFIPAIVPNPIKEPAKIQVSFRIPSRTNYWIVAAGIYQDAIDGTYSLNAPQQPVNQTTNNSTTVVDDVYEWAIISGGRPNVETTNGKCVAGTFGRYDVRGLWMFTREPFPPTGVIEAVTTIASDLLDLDTTVWRNVTHTGCTDY